MNEGTWKIGFYAAGADFGTLEHQLRKHLNRKTEHLNTVPGI
jgi:hypothetical protein